ncbi:SRPBCC family protein [Klenkia terrae]
MTGTFSAIADGRRTVTFVRVLPASPERVWAALTESADLAVWLAPATIEPRVGGAVRIEFDGEDSLTTGTVLTWDPPRTLEHGWHYPGEDRSVVRYDLVAVEGGTELTLVHRLLRTDQAPGYGAGWHADLDALAARLAGVGHDWDAAFGELLPRYRALAG